MLDVEQVVVDHDSGRLVWAAPGHDPVTLGRFFDALGPERCQHVRLGRADAAEWIARVVAARRLNAVLCADPLHIPAFARFAPTITQHWAAIQAALTCGRSNGLVESVIPKIRLLTRVAVGFRSPDALIALTMLTVGGLCPPLPR